MTSRRARSLWIGIHLSAALALSALILALLSLSELEPGEHPMIGLIAILMITPWLAIIAAAAGLIVLPVLALLAWTLVDRLASPIAYAVICGGVAGLGVLALGGETFVATALGSQAIYPESWRLATSWLIAAAVSGYGFHRLRPR